MSQTIQITSIKSPRSEIEVRERAELAKLLPQQPQRQDSLNDQLVDLLALANRAGMYDAADFLARYIR